MKSIIDETTIPRNTEPFDEDARRTEQYIRWWNEHIDKQIIIISRFIPETIQSVSVMKACVRHAKHESKKQ